MPLHLSVKQVFPTQSTERPTLLQLSVKHARVSPTQSTACVLLLQLSMDHVQVFPDGELNVQAAASRDTSPSFVRPISKAGQHRPRNITEVPKLQRCHPHLSQPPQLLPVPLSPLIPFHAVLIACLMLPAPFCCCYAGLIGCLSGLYASAAVSLLQLLYCFQAFQLGKSLIAAAECCKCCTFI